MYVSMSHKLYIRINVYMYVRTCVCMYVLCSYETMCICMNVCMSIPDPFPHVAKGSADLLLDLMSSFYPLQVYTICIYI